MAHTRQTRRDALAGEMSAWHRAPYTVRWLVHDATYMDIVIVLHTGGRVMDRCLRSKLVQRLRCMGRATRRNPWHHGWALWAMRPLC